MLEHSPLRSRLLLLVTAALTAAACDGSENVGPEADSGTEGDTGSEADNDSDPECDAVTDEKYRWHTFYGHDDVEMSFIISWYDSYGIAVDASGNTYVTGHSYDPWTGPGDAAPLHAHSGGSSDLFVLKLDADGSYLWHTFFGAADSSVRCHGVSVTSGGELYVVGSSDATWNGPGGESPLNAADSGVPGWHNAFVLKLASTGAYQWHTFYGPAIAGEISIAGEGDLYVSGYSYVSWDGPSGQVPRHAFTNDGNEELAEMDVFVLKLSTDGSYQWHTFYGSVSDEYSSANTVDASGNVYVSGISGAYWTGPSGESPLYGYLDNAFVLKLAPDGGYIWHFFVPGLMMESIATDGSDSLYVTGSSLPWNGPGGESPLHVGSGDKDAFVLKVGADGEYQWHTFYGEYSELGGLDDGASVSVNESGEPFITGYTFATWAGPGGECPLHAYSGKEDNYKSNAFVLALDADGDYLWHTFYGAEFYNLVLGLDSAIGPDGMLYLTGLAEAPWDGPTGQSPLHAYADDRDIFVLKLAP